MITEDYVSLETAKLLKEKGFNEPTVFRYGDYPNNDDLLFAPSGIATVKNSETQPYFYSAPTLQMVMKWLRKVHNLHIAVIVAYNYLPRRYEAHIMKLEDIDDFILHQRVDFASYEEACEAAIKYCLENLI